MKKCEHGIKTRIFVERMVGMTFFKIYKNYFRGRSKSYHVKGHGKGNVVIHSMTSYV